LPSCANSNGVGQRIIFCFDVRNVTLVTQEFTQACTILFDRNAKLKTQGDDLEKESI
jgi:hypothetical protein